MASYGEGNAKPMSIHDTALRVEGLGGAPPQLGLRPQDLPGWAFVVAAGRVVYVSASLASWMGYEAAGSLVGAAVSTVVAGPLSPARDQGRLLLALLRRDGVAVHVEMASIEVHLGDNVGQLFWAPGQGAELPSKPRRSSHMASLAAGLAHELNNPLTYLALNLGFVERELASLEGGPLDAEAHQRSVRQALDALHIAKEGAERLSTIVRDLRAFSRAGDGIKPVDPRRTLEMALALTRNNLRHKTRLQLDIGDVGDVDANEAQLGQCFVSLLLAMTQGLPDGDVASHTLEVHLDQADPLDVELRLALAGPAAPAALGSDPDVARCRAQISSFGGELITHGASLVVRLRGADAPRSATTISSIPPSSAPSSRPRVLLVEDDPQVADALTLLLGLEADVEHVDSGRLAIEVLLRDQSFQLILCDLMMPDIGGIDVHESIRRARPGVEERIVFLTGGAFTQRTRDFLRSMPNRTLDKPIDPALLLSLVRAHQR